MYCRVLLQCTANSVPRQEVASTIKVEYPISSTSHNPVTPVCQIIIIILQEVITVLLNVKCTFGNCIATVQTTAEGVHRQLLVHHQSSVQWWKEAVGPFGQMRFLQQFCQHYRLSPRLHHKARFCGWSSQENLWC